MHQYACGRICINPMVNHSKGKQFWDKEYKQAGQEDGHLALSAEPSEDLQKFTRWMEREYGRQYLNPLASVMDLGCGNGRNLLYMARDFGMRGVGYDISDEAIRQARAAAKDFPALGFHVRSIAEPLFVPDASQTIVLDMMTSHFLNTEERVKLLKEIVRVLKSGGWLFFKTFLRDEDAHAERLLREAPSGEEGTYIHPRIGVPEHVFAEDEIVDLLSNDFSIHKIARSHRHLSRDKKGKLAGKRRSVSVYAQKI